MQESQKWNKVEQGLRYFKQQQKKNGVVEIIPANAQYDMRRILESVDWDEKLVANTIALVFMKGSDKSWRKFVTDFPEDASTYINNKQDQNIRKAMLNRTVGKN